MEIKRYCSHCRQSFDFDINSLEDLDHLVCPQCGGNIEKDSRPTVENGGKKPDQMEKIVTDGIITLVNIRYYLFVVLAIIGAVGFGIGSNFLTYAMAIALMLSFGVLNLTATRYDFLFFVAVTVVEVVVYFKFGASLQQLCLVLFVAFVIRHIIKDIIFRLWMVFIGWAGKQK